MDKTLQRLIERRDRLTIAIDILMEETAEKRQAKTWRQTRTAAAALEKANDILSRPAIGKRKRVYKWNPLSKANRGDREIKTIPITDTTAASLRSLDLSKAIILAVQAVKKAIPTPELTLLLETAGVTFPPNRIPRRRYIGMLAARLVADKQLRKTPDGWVFRK